MNAICRGLRTLTLRPNLRPLYSSISAVQNNQPESAWHPQGSFIQQQQNSSLHTCQTLAKGMMPREVKNWPKYNDIVYPPRKPGEPMRPAEVVHHWSNIKYSQKKLWYICMLVRGKSIDEAVKQLSFYQRKGGAIVKDILIEAQEMAVRDHNVEFKSNLWVADARALRAYMIKGLRKGSTGRHSRILYRYTHFLVRLREGQPPKDYYAPTFKSGNELMEDYIVKLRARHIRSAL